MEAHPAKVVPARVVLVAEARPVVAQAAVEPGEEAASVVVVAALAAEASEGEVVEAAVAVEAAAVSAISAVSSLTSLMAPSSGLVETAP